MRASYITGLLTLLFFSWTWWNPYYQEVLGIITAVLLMLTIVLATIELKLEEKEEEEKGAEQGE